MKKALRAAIAFGLAAFLLSGCREDVPPAPSEPTTQPQQTIETTLPTEPTTIPTEPTTAPTEEKLTGWQELDGKLYYYDENGEPFLGWLVTEEATYYLNEDGSAQTGWTDLGDHTYYFRSDGVMYTGWMEEDGHSYYFLENGAMAQGWAEIGGDRYYFGGDGTMYTGWLYRGDYAYYLQDDGTAAVGPTQINGDTYYFSPRGVHIILVNPWNFMPGDYTTELVIVEGEEVSIQCAEALERMFAACRADGCEPVLLSANRSMETQTILYQRKVDYYLDLGYDTEDARYLAGQVVAVPGTSEHQLGLAVDIVDNYNWNLDETQESTETQQWLMEHCWEYGFILRYPNGSTDITGIIYEPWHYRYVGVEVAMEIRDLGITLEEYLGAA